MGYAIKGLVRGVVQGVGFRDYVRRNAIELGIKGSAKNLPDGRVQVIFDGQRGKINELQYLVINGPPTASVSAISWELVEIQTQEGFVIG